MTFFLVIISLFLLDVYPQELNKNCKDKDHPITADNVDIFDLVNVLPNENLTLECNYCDDKDDGQPKNWYKTHKPGLEEPTEVLPDMANEMNLNKIKVNSNHSLSIVYVTDNDTGVYYCKRFLEEDIRGNFSYFVDLIEYSNNTDMESGNISVWRKYHDENLSPINKLFSDSEGQEFVRVRQELNISMELITYWYKWGSCDVCGRPQGQGIRKKRGTCRIKLRSTFKENRTLPADEMVFLTVSEMSCKSMTLQRVFPGISNLTKIVPDFVLSENCEGICNPNKDNENAGWKVGKSRDFKYRKTLILHENSHLTLMCPESTVENKVLWKKGGKRLKPGDGSYSHLYVDTFSTMYLVNITKEEEGNYTCQVDDIKMQQLTVYVVSKSKYFTGELARHVGYLSFILLLTVPCYCAGLVVTWWRRHTFKTYEELVNEFPDEADEDSTESLL